MRSLHIKSLSYQLPEKSALAVGSILLRLQMLSVLGVQRSLVQSSNLMSTILNKTLPTVLAGQGKGLLESSLGRKNPSKKSKA